MEAYRGSVLHFLEDPDQCVEAESYAYFEDGLLLVEHGQVVAAGSYEELHAQLPTGLSPVDYSGQLILPGFVDNHIHYPQTEMIAAYGEKLLQWLETYTFPTESQFSDFEYASAIAERFLDTLLANGTTTAMVYGTVHPQSVDAFFEACEKRDLRMIAGKPMMDRNSPDYILDTAQSSYDDSKALIERWHKRGRLAYAVTPRFAPSSSPEQLALAGKLLEEYPDVYMQTHIAENTDEVAWVAELFPEAQNYLDTYDRVGLLGPRSVFAHCIHLQDAEWQRLAETNSRIAFCAASNLFLGSGLFKLERAVQEGVCVGMGTDVGGGNTFSTLQNLADAYKIQQLNDYRLTPFKAFYLATLGGARSLDCDKVIGNFLPGKEADFVVLDRAATDFLAFRMAHCKSLLEELFVLVTLGDDRAVRATYAAGRCVHERGRE
ncbi:MAG: guanine deaminase [Pseudomonadota bacterium]